MARPKNRRDVAPVVRWAIDEAIKKIGSRAFSDKIVDEINEHGPSILSRYACFFPKEIHAEVSTTVTQDEWLLERSKGITIDQETDDTPATH